MGRTVATFFLVSTVAVAACGGSKPPAAAPAPAPAPTLPPGDTGFPGLDWGDDDAAVTADYPATSGLVNWKLEQQLWGRPAVVVLTMGESAGLTSIEATYRDTFASMEACATVWRELRAKIDAAYGRSAAENLAAFWTSDTHQVILGCNPTDDDGGGATLSLHLLPPSGDEE